MSSSTGLGRTRSLRQPASITTTSSSSTDSNPKGSAATRNTSPSRLPQIKPLTRSATTASATSSAATRARPSASSTTTTTTTSRRPLSGIFSTPASSRRPGATSTAAPDSTATTTTTTTATTKPAPKRRPLSGVFSARTTASAARRASPTSTGPENNNTTAAPKSLGRAPSIRQAPSSTATTTTTTTTLAPTAANSKREPAGLSQATTGHGRPKSIATATALTSATTLKPPSSQTAASTSTSTPTSAAAKPLTRAQTLGRNAPPAGNASSAAAAAPPSSANPTSRPAFNTNQQHYSPLKSHAPKPMTSTFLAPPSPSKLPANVAISAETARRQTELLQLSLLHREAAATDKAWHASAEAKLGARFAMLVAEDEELRRAERDRIEDRNVAVLLQWGQDGPLGLDEKVQILDQVLSGVWDLSEPGGRYARVADEFEKWAERVADIVAARQSGDLDSLLQLGGQGPESDVLLFVSELDNHWRDECAGLLRRLDEWRRALQRLGGGDADVVARLDPEAPRPSLLRMLEGARALVGDMLAELAVMQQMEREATRAEDEWIEKMNAELNLGDARERTIPLWKLVA